MRSFWMLPRTCSVPEAAYTLPIDRKEQSIRRLAAARRRGDFDEVRSLLAEEVVWHEPGDADYSGDHRDADEVVALIKKLSEIPLVLEPQEVIVTDKHAAARTRWWAERADTRVEGNELAVYRFAGEKIAEVWFWYDGYDQAAHDLVFSFDQRSSK
jgi:ketosteroid isomerase-like protein